jgi:glycosidase
MPDPSGHDAPIRLVTMAEIRRDQPIGAIAQRLRLDRLTPRLAWATFLDNHDLPRLRSVCTDEGARLALAALFALRGIPVLTYGVEAGFAGKGDPENRSDLEFPVQSPFRELIARLSDLRARHPALADGLTQIAEASRDSLALLRSTDSEVAWISIARSGSAAPAPPTNTDWAPVWRENARGISLRIRIDARDRHGQLASARST